MTCNLLTGGNTGAPGHPGPKGDAGKSISAPGVMVSPTSFSVTQTQTATFYCSADGYPVPSVSWRKLSGKKLIITDDIENKLEIINASYNDSGKYVCTATNILGKVEKEVKLLVEGTLRLLSLKKDIFSQFYVVGGALWIEWPGFKA